MIDHVSITVTDIARARRFYDAVMAALGYPCTGSDDNWAGYGERCTAERPDLSYLSLRVVDALTETDRRHWAFKATDRAAVNEFYRAALASGGTPDGAPGLRREYHSEYYAAFVRDPDGNRIEAVCHRPA